LKRAGAAAVLLGLGLGAGCAGPPPAPAPSPSAAASAAASLAVEPASFDFGRVLPGRTLHKEFQLRNLGRQAVAIESVTTDCGCMVVGEYARELAAGAATKLTVQLQTPEQPGTVVRSLVVRTGGASPASVELRVRATVVGEDGPGSVRGG
jgi:hypothetical protein